MFRVHFNQLASTNDKALSLACLNPQKPLAVSADSQSAGRGRRGRVWQSPVGGVWMSLVFPLHGSPMGQRALPLVVGLAIKRVVSDLLELSSAHHEVCIKWPNDILVDGKKLAGILCESRIGQHLQRPLTVIGLGLNANLDPAQLGSDLRTPATSLRELLGHDLDLAQLRQQIVSSIYDMVERFDRQGMTPVMAMSISRCLAWLGQDVEVHAIDRADSDVVFGKVVGIDLQGRLLIDDDTLVTHAIESGEIKLRQDMLLTHEGNSQQAPLTCLHS